jgi:hypothetical protein
MTPDDPRDPRPDAAGPPPSLDELASALLDGELGDADAAVRARPDVVARAAAMEDARRALRDLPVPPHAGRDRAVAAALAAFDDEVPGDVAGSPPAPLGAPARRAQRWLAAAAAAAALAGLAGLAVATAGDGDDHDTAGSAADEATAGDDGADASGEGGAAPDQTAAEEAPGAGAESHEQLAAVDAGDLGSFASADALVVRVTALLAQDDGAGSVPPVDPDGGADAAFRQACADDPPAPLAGALATVLGGRAVVDQQPVDVWVVDTAGGRRVVAIDDTCTTVVDRPLG